MISKVKFASSQDHQYMKDETELMTRVRGHPNVVSLHDSLEDKGNYYLVMDLCAGGELMDRIVKHRHFSEKVASKYFRQMLEAVQHCHARNVMHRDIKPENFLFASHEEQSPLRLADFGLAAFLASPDAELTEPCGSAYYIAPEVFAHRFGRSADLWSLGVILYLMLSGTVRG